MFKFPILLVVFLSVSFFFTFCEATTDLSMTATETKGLPPLPRALPGPYKKCLRECLRTVSLMRTLGRGPPVADRAVDGLAVHMAEDEATAGVPLGSERGRPVKSDYIICINVCFAVNAIDGHDRLPRVCHCAGKPRYSSHYEKWYCPRFKCP